MLRSGAARNHVDHAVQMLHVVSDSAVASELRPHGAIPYPSILLFLVLDERLLELRSGTKKLVD